MHYFSIANTKAARMKDSEERQRSLTGYRREAEAGSRKKLFRRMGGRRLL
jgi:hypothetical protein